MKKRLIYYTMTVMMICSFIVSNQTVFAVNDFYSANDINFYDSSDTGCISSPSADIHSSPNSNNNQEVAAKFFTSTKFSGNKNKPMNAIQTAAIMGNIQQESGFNPNAGDGKSYKGIVQWSSPGRWDSIKDPKTDLSNQLNYIKTELDGSYKNKLDEFWEASSPDDLNKATYAITRNYEVAVATDKAPTSWTNETDAINNVQDWVKRKNFASSFYDKYGNLAASGSDYIPGSECGGLVSGGMTLKEAKAFMNEYKSLEPKDWPEGTSGTKYNINGTTCSGGSLANCVAFSQYFINRYTSKKITHPGNGESVVGQLIGLGFTDGGHTPRVYSVFSKSGGTYGHTGVVLGINKEKDEIIIGEAGCGESFDWIDARSYSLSVFSGDSYTYAYTDSTPTEDSNDAK